jgi:hypothetical protein
MRNYLGGICSINNGTLLTRAVDAIKFSSTGLVIFIANDMGYDSKHKV